MVPLINSVNPMIVPPPLAATPMADAIASLRVPADNVAPSVANQVIHNNSRGGSAAIPTPAAAAVSGAVSSAGSVALSAANAMSASPSIVASATFLAQLIGQDLSPAAQSMLIQYEKMLALGNVKYKPSNATKPPPEPAGLFGRLLAQQRASQPAQPPVQTPPPAAASSTAPPAAAATTAPAEPARPPAARGFKPVGTAAPRGQFTPPSHAVGAYHSTIARNTSIPLKAAGDISVEETNAAA